MTPNQDIREITVISHEDIVGLNFINPPDHIVFRKHFRQGLRSHVIAVLEKKALRAEIDGDDTGPVTVYPMAKPLKMLRIFKVKLKSKEVAWREIEKLSIIARYLAPRYIAQSYEFITDYYINGHYEIMLCGLQDFVAGEVLDPWQHLSVSYFQALFENFSGSDRLSRSMGSFETWYCRLVACISGFISQLKAMIIQDHFIPDLSGIGNLMITPQGELKLVDINNISPVRGDAAVHVDDKGYPACDKSIEVLARLEEKILEREINLEEPLYNFFMTATRRAQVKACEEAFFKGTSYLPHTF